jgi:hypothetical protein
MEAENQQETSENVERASPEEAEREKKLTPEKKAAERFVENLKKFKNVVNASMSKGDLIRLCHFIAEYPMHEKTPTFINQRQGYIAALAAQLKQDVTMMAIHKMGGKFVDISEENKPEAEAVPEQIENEGEKGHE